LAQALKNPFRLICSRRLSSRSRPKAARAVASSARSRCFLPVDAPPASSAFSRADLPLSCIWLAREPHPRPPASKEDGAAGSAGGDRRSPVLPSPWLLPVPGAPGSARDRRHPPSSRSAAAASLLANPEEPGAASMLASGPAIPIRTLGSSSATSGTCFP
jgi:hypothetical protein